MKRSLGIMLSALLLDCRFNFNLNITGQRILNFLFFFTIYIIKDDPKLMQDLSLSLLV